MEEWREYSTNNSYEISSLGSVRYRKLVGKKESFISIKPKCFGKYSSVTIGLESLPLHTLVATVFIPNPDNKSYVRHKNGNTRDNSVTNLEWAKRNGGRPRKDDKSLCSLPSVTTSSASIQTPDDDYIIQTVGTTSKYAVFYKKYDDIRFIGVYDSYDDAYDAIR